MTCLLPLHKRQSAFVLGFPWAGRDFCKFGSREISQQARCHTQLPSVRGAGTFFPETRSGVRGHENVSRVSGTPLQLRMHSCSVWSSDQLIVKSEHILQIHHPTKKSRMLAVTSVYLCASPVSQPHKISRTPSHEFCIYYPLASVLGGGVSCGSPHTSTQHGIV